MSVPESRKRSLLDSRWVGELGLGIGRTLPPALGFRLADFIAARLAARKTSPLARAVRANQWMIQGGAITAPELDRAVQEVLSHTVRSFYLLYHYLDNDAALRGFLVVDDDLAALIAAYQARQRGQLLLGVHMCYFDLALQGLARNGLRALALSLPQASPVIEWQHELRRRSGLEIVPASLPNLRLVLERLRAGEMVTTGADRPMGEVKCTPEFFGRPSHVPVHYIQLALKARVPVRVLAPVMQADGRIQIIASAEIEMEPCADRQEELLSNARRVLEIVASFIVRYPRQWGMTWPVWPDIDNKIP